MGLLGLMAAGRVHSKAVSRGVRYLLDTRKMTEAGMKACSPEPDSRAFSTCVTTATPSTSHVGTGRVPAFSADEDTKQIMMRRNSPLDLGRKW